MSPFVIWPSLPSSPKTDDGLANIPAPAVTVPAIASPLLMKERRFAGFSKLFGLSFTGLLS